MRADARRNRARVLEAAEAVFSRAGVGASTEEVAREAGVGIGTVFRHFPTKEALLDALLVRRVTQVAEHAEVLAGGEDAASALQALVGEVLRQAAQKGVYAQALSDAGRPHSPELVQAQRRAVAALDALLRRAQEMREIRADVRTEDFIALATGLAQAAQNAGWGAEVRERTLRVLFDGLRAGSAPDPAGRVS